MQDYQQGRKTASTTAFGQTSAFGGAQPSGSSIFGQQNSQPAQSSSIFGAPKPATGFGAFGGNTTNTNTGAFGSTAFGQPQQQQQQQQQRPATGFGAFGQQQQPQQGSSIFGGTNTGGSAFGTSKTDSGSFDSNLSYGLRKIANITCLILQVIPGVLSEALGMVPSAAPLSHNSSSPLVSLVNPSKMPTLLVLLADSEVRRFLYH